MYNSIDYLLIAGFNGCSEFCNAILRTCSEFEVLHVKLTV